VSVRRDGGFLLLHVWMESAARGSLRVRVTSMADVNGPDVEVVETTSIDVAVTETRAWLERFVEETS
jgi:hypothetical protein